VQILSIANRLSVANRLDKNRNNLYSILLNGIPFPVGASWAGEGPWLFEKLADHNPPRESERRRDFLISFARNPLKSPDSEKQKEANESVFACFYMPLFSSIFTEFAPWLYPRLREAGLAHSGSEFRFKRRGRNRRASPTPWLIASVFATAACPCHRMYLRTPAASNAARGSPA
jgi:hypothetical protein